MSLLSPAQDAQIRDAIKSVTDTFMVTPVTYHAAIDTVDRFQEDRAKDFNDISISGLVEYPKNDRDKTEKAAGGAVDDSEVIVTLNWADGETAGLTTAENSLSCRSDKDFMTVKGVRYRLTLAVTDGPLSDVPVLIVLYGAKVANVS